MTVESKNNPSALGDYSPLPIGSHESQAQAIKDGIVHPLAIGCLQIHESVVIDVNNYYHTKFVWPKDCLDVAKSKRICQDYLMIYCTKARLHHEPTMEDASRIWNGGPNGANKDSTLEYWDKVETVLQAIQTAKQ